MCRALVAGIMVLGDKPSHYVQEDVAVQLTNSKAHDLVDRKRIEETLRALSRAVEQSPVSIIIADRDGNIEYVNRRFEEVTGYSREEAIGRNPRILKSGNTAPRVYEELWNTITRGGEWRGELCNRNKGGELFWEHAAISGLQDADGTVSRYVCVKEDITLRKQAEESRLNSQKLESLGTLASGIAHDFNSILSAVNANVVLALEDLADDHPARECVLEIANASARGADLVRRIVTFSRPHYHERKLIELQPVVEEALKLLSPLLPAHIRVSTRFARELPSVSADASQIHEAIINLATNAADAIGDRPGLIGFSLATIEAKDGAAGLARLSEGRYACLSVRDNGCGMDEATTGHIFDAFFTTKPAGKGSGLGLAMVYGIMKAHGGAVVVSSRPGEGSTFHLYFPVCEGESHGSVTN